MVDKRFLHPYYLLNSGLILTYALLRAQRLSPGALALEDMFGISRESQIYFCLGLMLFTRALSAPTLDAYISSAFMFTRISILLLLWNMHRRLFAFFAALWTLIYVVFPQPRYRMPDYIATLNNASFEDRIGRNTHRTIYVLWCHATWSARSSQLAPVLATLAKGYRHPRMKFARLDVSKYPNVAEKLGVGISAGSKELPTVICFKKGKEVSRIPRVDDGGNIPKQWSRGFTAGHVAQELDLNEHLAIAKQWEEEARRKYRERASS